MCPGPGEMGTDRAEFERTSPFSNAQRCDESARARLLSSSAPFPILIHSCLPEKRRCTQIHAHLKRPLLEIRQPPPTETCLAELKRRSVLSKHLISINTMNIIISKGACIPRCATQFEKNATGSVRWSASSLNNHLTRHHILKHRGN